MRQRQEVVNEQQRLAEAKKAELEAERLRLQQEVEQKRKQRHQQQREREMEEERKKAAARCQCYKTFCGRKLRIFVISKDVFPCKPFRPSLMFEGKFRSLT